MKMQLFTQHDEGVCERRERQTEGEREGGGMRIHLLKIKHWSPSGSQTVFVLMFVGVHVGVYEGVRWLTHRQAPVRVTPRCSPQGLWAFSQLCPHTHTLTPQGGVPSR